MGRRARRRRRSVSWRSSPRLALWQAQRYFREGSFAARWAPAQMPDASFVICRARLSLRSHASTPESAGRPTTRTPRSTSRRGLSELTKTRVSRDDSKQPNFYVVRLTDDQLFNCPITVVSDAGTIGIQRRRGGAAANVSAEGRLPLGGRLLGNRGVGAVGIARSRRCCRPPSIRSKTCGSTIRCCTACSR